MASYQEKLTDPRWQKKRLEILERDGWKCRYCNDGKSTLHVHHILYISGNQPWEYKDSNFITLCEKCHKTDHKHGADNVFLTVLAKETGLTTFMLICCLSLLIMKYKKEGFVSFMKSQIDPNVKSYFGDFCRKFISEVESFKKEDGIHNA